MHGVGTNSAICGLLKPMPKAQRVRAPSGDLTTFEREQYEANGYSHRIYRKGHGPAVLILTELPGITPHVLGFADRIIAQGCTVILPDLFGVAGRDPFKRGRLGFSIHTLRALTQIFVRREFALFATGKTAPIVNWLRALAEREHARCGGPGVGVIGMCITAGAALAMACDPRVLAPVLSQPCLPAAFDDARRYAIDASPETLDRVASRCMNEGLRVVGLRFRGDPLVPSQRFRLLKERLGEGFVAVELPPDSGHPDSYMPHPHAVLTSELIDEVDEPTRLALDQVLYFVRDQLIGGAIHVSA